MCHYFFKYFPFPFSLLPMSGHHSLHSSVHMLLSHSSLRLCSLFLPHICFYFLFFRLNNFHMFKFTDPFFCHLQTVVNSILRLSLDDTIFSSGISMFLLNCPFFVFNYVYSTCFKVFVKSNIYAVLGYVFIDCFS